jgi:hypothetical protein
MHRMLAGHTPLQDMISQVIDSAHTKMASSEPPSGPKFRPMDPKHEKKVVKREEEDRKEWKDKEKKSSAIDPTDPSDIEKLASALESVGDGFIKEAADSIENGGESRQGGGQLPTSRMVPGVQPYKRDGSKRHNIPLSTGFEASSDGNRGNRTVTPTDEHRAPGSGKAYPAKGVFKTAGFNPSNALNIGTKEGLLGVGALAAGGAFAKKKKASAEPQSDDSDVGFILDKIAETRQGGESPGEFASGSGPKPAIDGKGGNNVRKHLETNEGVINLTKREAKAPQRRMLAEVLDEPALSRSTDSKVHENLRNASKGGVKIAAAKSFLQKIAEDPNDPRHAKLKAALEKKRAEKKSDDKDNDSARS